MNTSADAADQVVRMSLNGAEVALKVSGKGAEKAAILIYHALKNAKTESKKTRGAIRLANLARSGKKLDVTEIMDSDLKKFCLEAKKYGILYTILKDRNRKDGMTEIMYKSEDKEKLGLIFDRLNMATYDAAQVQNEIASDLESKEPPEKTGPEVSDPDSFINELMKEPEKNPTKEEGQNTNPPEARTVKRDRSEPDSGKSAQHEGVSTDKEPTIGRRKSVREELAEIKAEMEKEEQQRKSRRKQPKVNEHKAPPKKKREKER
ncbi:MAG: PcfB family protein [Clostridiales bacterium]|nr:PcfB family protein [Clostridiales bacterium]